MFGRRHVDEDHTTGRPDEFYIDRCPRRPADYLLRLWGCAAAVRGSVWREADSAGSGLRAAEL